MEGTEFLINGICQCAFRGFAAALADRSQICPKNRIVKAEIEPKITIEKFEILTTNIYDLSKKAAIKNSDEAQLNIPKDQIKTLKKTFFSNPNFKKKPKVSIFAHEIGHHLNGHTLFFALNAEGRRDNELQADKFSGFLMQKLGATIEQAQAGINILGSEDDSDTHPSKEKRLLGSIEYEYK